MDKKHTEEFDANKWCCCDSLFNWSSWASPIGLSLGIGILLISVGLFCYLLHLANLIGK